MGEKEERQSSANEALFWEKWWWAVLLGHVVLGVVGVVAVVCFCFYYKDFVSTYADAHTKIEGCVDCIRDAWSQVGTVGDSFGVLNTFFTGLSVVVSFLAFVGFICALYVQREELAQQRAEMKQSRKEMMAQTDLLEEQLEIAEQQLLSTSLPAHVQLMNDLRVRITPSTWVHPFKKGAVDAADMFDYFAESMGRYVMSDLNSRNVWLSSVWSVFPELYAQMLKLAPYANLFNVWVTRVQQSKLEDDIKEQYVMNLESCLYHTDKTIIAICYIETGWTQWTREQLRRVGDDKELISTSLFSLYTRVRPLDCLPRTKMEIAYVLYKFIANMKTYIKAVENLNEEGSKTIYVNRLEQIIADARKEYAALRIGERWFPQLALEEVERRRNKAR